MADLAWHKAKRILRLTAPDWPEAFLIGQLAWLQYPLVAARQNRKAFEDAIYEAIGAGTIQADSTVEQRTNKVLVGYLDSFNLNVSRDTPRHKVARYETSQHEVTVVRLTRAAFARWWGQRREAKSEHVEAWLDSGDEHCTTPVTSGKGAAPEKWNRGLKLVAWECAQTLKAADGAITGVALWNAMVADSRVSRIQTDCSDTLKFKSGSTALVGGEASIQGSTVQKDWRKQLEQLMT